MNRYIVGAEVVAIRGVVCGRVVENYKLPEDICIEWENGLKASYNKDWLDKNVYCTHYVWTIFCIPGEKPDYMLRGDCGLDEIPPQYRQVHQFVAGGFDEAVKEFGKWTCGTIR